MSPSTLWDKVADVQTQKKSLEKEAFDDLMSIEKDYQYLEGFGGLLTAFNIDSSKNRNHFTSINQQKNHFTATNQIARSFDVTKEGKVVQDKSDQRLAADHTEFGELRGHFCSHLHAS